MNTALDLRPLRPKNADRYENVNQPDGIRKFARPGFAEEQPDANRWLKRFALTEDQLNALLLEVYDSQSTAKEVTRTWILNHAKIIAAWIAPEEKCWQKVF
ncbi:MAG: ABC-type proline/glycine betaine transport system substrate-binding protein [Yoonia sp.]|jgi:ABC-type proline/glycine betaine transport system substrate-binding protein